MAKGTATKGLRNVHTKSIKGLAWASFVFAFAVGAMMPDTFLGNWIRKAIGWLPEDYGIEQIAVVVVLVIGWIAVILDVYVDIEPNQVAVYGAMLLPTVATALSGGFVDWIEDLSNWFLGLVDQMLFAANPNGIGPEVLTITAAIAVGMTAQRVVKKSRKG